MAKCHFISEEYILITAIRIDFTEQPGEDILIITYRIRTKITGLHQSPEAGINTIKNVRTSLHIEIFVSKAQIIKHENDVKKTKTNHAYGRGFFVGEFVERCGGFVI